MKTLDWSVETLGPDYNSTGLWLCNNLLETLRLNNADVTRPWTLGRGRCSRGGKINVKNSAFKNVTKNLHFIFYSTVKKV